MSKSFVSKMDEFFYDCPKTTPYETLVTAMVAIIAGISGEIGFALCAMMWYEYGMYSLVYNY